MATGGLITAPMPPHRSTAEAHKRQNRWRLFQIIFVLTYVGIMLDVATTALGVEVTGAGYEQNPIGGFLIAHAGWAGLLFLLTEVCLVMYVSLRVVYYRARLGWSLALNIILVLAMAFRWLAVVTAMMYILQPVL